MIFIYMSIGTCVVAFPKMLQDKLSIYVIGFWAAIVPLLVIVKIPIVTFFFIIGALLYMQRIFSPVQSLFIFIALVAAVPTWFDYMLSAGGTDIFHFRYWKLLLVCLFVPLLPALLAKKMPFDFVDILFVIFVIFLSFAYLFLDERLTLLTAIRFVIDMVLFHFVTYFVISRVISLQPKDAIINISYGFMVMGLILAGVFVFNQAINADLYNVHTTASHAYGAAYIREYRGGFLRAEGPLSGEVMGLVLAASAGSLFFLRSLVNFSWFKYAMCMALFLLACITTGSRGVLFSFMLVASSFIFLRSSAAIKVMLVLAVVVLFFAITAGVPVYNDEHGTFDFRKQLFEASFRFIAENPFGDSFYASHHYFDHLRRGSTRFLDIVSVYLQYLLPFGYLGLFLYVAPFVFTVIQLVGLSVFTPQRAGIYADIMRLYAALLVGYLFMISTVSSVGLIDLIGLVFLAISRGLIMSARQSSV